MTFKVITKIGLNTGFVVYILKYLNNCTLMLTVRYVSKSSDSIITAITYKSFCIVSVLFPGGSKTILKKYGKAR